MKTIYVYVLDSMAEWEIAHITQAVSMQRMIRKDGPEFEIKTVALTKAPVRTLGGLTVIPDITLDEMEENKVTALLLPGAETWLSDVHKPVINTAITLMNKGVLVGAVCGATLALAEYGVLDEYGHTSNSLDFLKMFSKHYKGERLYVQESAHIDRDLVTASSAGGLEWAKLIIERLELYEVGKIDLWYKYFKTGVPEYGLKLIS